MDFFPQVPNFLLEDGKCSCKEGQGGRCKHIAAVVEYVNTKEYSSRTNDPRKWGKPSVKSLGIYQKGACLDSFYGKQVEEVVALPPAAPPVQDATAVAALLEDLWGEDCTLLTAIGNELSPRVLAEVDEAPPHSAPVITGNMRTTELYRSTESWNNTDLEMEFYMSNVVATPDELLHIEARTREPGRDVAYWRNMRIIRISASSRPHTVLRSRRDPAAVAEVF